MTTGEQTQRRREAQRRGLWAETLACWALRLKGYRIVARNWRCPLGEIDIIARRGSILAVIEVKNRLGLAPALEAISPRQRLRVERAASAFIARRPDCQSLDVRFDAVTIEPWKWPKHLAGAWHPDSC